MAGGPSLRQAERVSAEAEARRAEFAETAPNTVPAEDASFREDFLEALDVTFREKIRLGVNNTIGVGGDTIQEVIERRTPEQFIDALVEAEQDPSRKEMISSINDYPELAKALHGAVANDTTMLNILGAEDDGAFTANDLKGVLNDPMQRDIMTQVLTKIGDGSKDLGGDDVDYSHLKTIIDTTKNGTREEMLAAVNDTGASVNLFAGITSFQDIIDLLKNPGEFIQQFVESLDIQDPQIENMIAGFADIASKGLGGFADLEGDFVGHYYRGGKALGEGIAQEYGAPIMNASYSDQVNSGEISTQAEAARTGETPLVKASFDPAATAQSTMDGASRIAEATVVRTAPAAYTI